jgi:uncharacterized protein (TIGR03086 family)
MATDLLNLYRQASDWTISKVRSVTDLDAPTPCTDWSVRELLSHMLDTQRYFTSAARGEDASPPSPTPPPLDTPDPESAFSTGQSELLAAFGAEGVIDKTGPSLGIAFADQLLHGWDVARATDQDATMPDGLAEVAYKSIRGRFTDDQRKGVFGPELTVADDATPQQRLLAYTGRDPS